ncbi:DNA topoisomerase 2-associated protein pat1 [Sorochytrium milnesiophthora]
MSGGSAQWPEHSDDIDARLARLAQQKDADGAYVYNSEAFGDADFMSKYSNDQWNVDSANAVSRDLSFGGNGGGGYPTHMPRVENGQQQQQPFRHSFNHPRGPTAAPQLGDDARKGSMENEAIRHALDRLEGRGMPNDWMPPPPPPPHAPFPHEHMHMQQQPTSLQEIEAQMMLMAAQQRQHMHSPHPHMPPPPAMHFSQQPPQQSMQDSLFAQLQHMALASGMPSQPPPPPPPHSHPMHPFAPPPALGMTGHGSPLPSPQIGGPGGGPTTLEELEQMMLMQQSKMRQEHQRAFEQISQPDDRSRHLARYNGFMTQYEKDQIARIQISQLVAADPLADDFYYQVYTVLRGTNPNEQQLLSGAPPLILRRTYQNNGGGNYHRRGYRDRYNNNNNNNSNNNRDRGRDGDRGEEREKDKESGDKTERNAEGERDKQPQNLQDQIQRIVDHAKKRPKATQLSLEGALGKIALTSVKNPRQLLQVSPAVAQADAKSQSPQLSVSRATLREILLKAEKLYSLVIKVEQLKRQLPGTRTGQNAPMVADEEGNARPMTLEEQEQEWNDSYNTAFGQVMQIIQIDQPAKEAIHPFVQILYSSKGKKLVSRLINILSTEQWQSLWLLLFAQAQSLDVVRNASIPALFAVPQLFPSMSSASSKPTPAQLRSFVDELECFMTNVVPAMVGFIADAPFDVLCLCMETLIDSRGNNMVRLASSKAGLAFLTMLLSRAEILKQASLSEADQARWGQIYDRLFGELQGHYLAFFPPTAVPNIPDDMNHSAHGGQTLEAYLTDDVHVWQFLASLAVGANAEQQHVLVGEVRDRILRNVATGMRIPSTEDASGEADAMSERSQRSIANVNLFLHALGLDASQIRT